MDSRPNIVLPGGAELAVCEDTEGFSLLEGKGRWASTRGHCPGQRTWEQFGGRWRKPSADWPWGQVLETGDWGPLGKAHPWRSWLPGGFRLSCLSQLALPSGMTSHGVSPLSCPQIYVWARAVGETGDLELREFGSLREPRRNLEQLRLGRASELLGRTDLGQRGENKTEGVGSHGNRTGGKRVRQRAAWTSKRKTNDRPLRR